LNGPASSTEAAGTYKDHADHRTVQVDVNTGLHHHGALQGATEKICPFQCGRCHLPVDCYRLPLQQEFSNLLQDDPAAIRGNYLCVVQPQIHPALHILGAHDNLLAHFERLDVEKTAHRGKVTATQGALFEGAVPGILPVQYEAQGLSEVTEVVDRHRIVVHHESDTGHRVAARRTEHYLRGLALQLVGQHGGNDGLFILRRHRQFLTGDRVPSYPCPWTNLDQAPRQGAGFRCQHQVAGEKFLQAFAVGSGAVSHLLVDLIGKQVAEGRQILQTDFQLHPDLSVLDKELGDGGGKHCPGSNNGIGSDFECQPKPDEQCCPSCDYCHLNGFPCHRIRQTA
jgi:hypothetical protein